MVTAPTPVPLEQEKVRAKSPANTNTANVRIITILLGSIEFYLRSGLLCAATSGHDVGAGVILTSYRIARKPPQHRDLAGVCKRVGDGALEETLGRATER